MLPLRCKLHEVVIRLANSVAKEKIGLVAELESDQLRTGSVHHASGFVGCILSRAGAHVQAVDQLPAAGVEEIPQMADGFGCNAHRRRRFVPGVGPDGHGKCSRIRFVPCKDAVRIRNGRLLCPIRSPVGKLAGVASDPQDAGGSQPSHESCQLGVAAREEIRIPELRRFIAQPGEIVDDFVAQTIWANRQANGRTGVALGNAEWRVEHSRRGRG